MSKLSNKTKLHLLIFAITFISLYAGLADYDWYWQVELGEAILKHGDFNAIYGLHWGSAGISQYLDHEWLTNILFYLCSLTGTYGISMAKVVVCFVYAGCTCWFLDEVGIEEAGDAGKVGVFAYLFLMATVFIKVKAYILSVGFLMVEMVFLRRYKAKRDTLYFVYMLLLLILWNNMHSGSMPLFFVVAGIYWLTDLGRERRVLYFLPGYLSGLLLNPYGYKLVLFDVMHNFDPVMKQIILDWRCIDGKETLGVLCTFLVLGVVFYLMGTDVKSQLFNIVMTFVILYMSFQSARHLVYLAPFVYPIMVNSKWQFSLSKTAKFCFTWFCVGIAVMSCIQGFSSPRYKTTYAMNYIDEELEEVILATNTFSSEGLFNCSESDVWSLGLDAFVSGAYPCVAERKKDEYELVYSASEARIEELIEKWGLTKFLAIKYNPSIEYSNRPGVLYEYLAKNDDYVLLYDSDFYFYFVRKDLV